MNNSVYPLLCRLTPTEFGIRNYHPTGKSGGLYSNRFRRLRQFLLDKPLLTKALKEADG